MWLTVGQLPRKSAWWDAFLNSKVFVEAISIALPLYFSHFILAMSAFAPVEISYSDIWNKSATEAWLCLISFSWLSFQSRFPILICNKMASEAESWTCLVSKVATEGVL